VRTLSFFNNKGGVGKTTLLYHVAHMFAQSGHRVLVADLDPQANSTGMMLTQERVEELWAVPPRNRETIYGCLDPLIRGVGDIGTAPLEEVASNLSLIPGDLALSTFEDQLSESWPKCHNGEERAYRVTTSMYRVVFEAAQRTGARWVFIDVGPNLGAINRAALIASDCVVVPVAPDLFSVQGLQNLGPSLRAWRKNWTELKGKSPDADMPMPSGEMRALGYVVLQHGIRDSRPPKAYQRWMNRIPSTFRSAVLEESEIGPSITDDPNCLASIKHYRSLVPMAMEARKPIFDLRPADGAIGAHVEAVSRVRSDFQNLMNRIIDSVEQP
jgi:chromosome partitioning protein